MKKIVTLIVALIICGYVNFALAAGTCAVSMSGDPNGIYTVTLALTAHTDGTVGTPTLSGDSGRAYSGVIVGALIDPGSPAPGAGYTVKALDQADATIDWLQGIGTSLASATNTVTDCPLFSSGMPVRLVDRKLTASGTGMNSGGKVNITLIIDNRE